MTEHGVDGDGPHDRRRSTPGSSSRSSASFASAARGCTLLPVHASRAEEVLAPRPRRRLPRQRPRRPGRARLRRRDGPRASSASGPSSASASATSCSAGPSAWRPSSCLRPPRRQPPGQGPAHRAGSRSPRRTTASRSRRPTAGCAIERDEPVRWETDFGAAELSHVNLYDRTVEGLTLLDVPGGTVQYHPEAGPGPQRRALPLRPLPRPGAGGRLMPRRDDIQKILLIGSGPDRDRPGGRVRLLRRAGLQGAARGGLRGRPRQLEPGDDHDRPGVRRPRPTSSRCCPARSPQIIERERPDALLPTLGGQTALNLAKALHEDGTLERFGVELIGADYDAIHRAEDRDALPRDDGGGRPADARGR